MMELVVVFVYLVIKVFRMNRNQHENAFKMSAFFIEKKKTNKQNPTEKMKTYIYIYICHIYVCVYFNLYVHDYYYYMLYIDYSGFYTVVYLIWINKFNLYNRLV